MPFALRKPLFAFLACFASCSVFLAAPAQAAITDSSTDSSAAHLPNAESPVDPIPEPWRETRPQDSADSTFLNGHNLTATSDILTPGHCVLGVDISACGVTDNFTVATSAWLLASYNMYSIAARGLISEDVEKNRWAYQVDYFRTYGRRETDINDYQKSNLYQMEALWFLLIHTIQFEPRYRLHLNFDVNYYFDEKMPFSLRRPYNGRTPWQLNVSMLNEVDLIDNWFMLGELGLLDFARQPVHIHTGASLGRRLRKWSFHGGFSMTGSPGSLFAPDSRADYQQNLRYNSVNGYDQNLDARRIQDDFSIHPEFALQYFF